MADVPDGRDRPDDGAGDYSIADIANWAWVRTHKWSGVGIDEFERLARRLAAIAARPAAQRGILAPPSPIDLDALEDDEDAKRKFTDVARTIVGGDRKP